MDCANTRLLLNLAARNLGELDPPDRDALHGHLKTCSACAAQAQADKAFDDILGPAMRAVPIRALHQSQLLERLRTRRRYRFGPWLAAAAAILLAVGLAGAWWHVHRPVDVELPAFSQFVSLDARPDQAAEWFGEKKLSFAFPQDFQVNYFQAFDVGRFQGRDVPRLFFVGPADGNQRAPIAYVYVLHESRFKIADLPARQTFSTHTIEVIPGQRDSGFAFVVIYPQGASLNALRVWPDA